MKATSGLPQLTSVCVECNKITVKSKYFMSVLKLNCGQAIYFFAEKIIRAAENLIDDMNVEGSTSELALGERNGTAKKQSTSLSKYSKIPKNQQAFGRSCCSISKLPTMVNILTKIFSNFG